MSSFSPQESPTLSSPSRTYIPQLSLDGGNAVATPTTPASTMPFFLPAHILSGRFSFSLQPFLQPNQQIDARQFISEYISSSSGAGEEAIGGVGMTTSAAESALQTLQQELVELRQLLREETISLVDKDFQRFIEFSGQLQRMKGRVQQLRQLLSAMTTTQSHATAVAVNSHAAPTTLMTHLEQNLAKVRWLIQECEVLLIKMDSSNRREQRAREWIEVQQLISNWSTEFSRELVPKISVVLSNGSDVDEDAMLAHLRSMALEWRRLSLLLEHYATLLETELNQQSNVNQEQQQRHQRHYMIISRLKDRCTERYDVLRYELQRLCERLLLERYGSSDSSSSDHNGSIRKFHLVLEIFALIEQRTMIEEHIRDRIFKKALDALLGSSSSTASAFFDALISMLSQPSITHRYFSVASRHLGYQFLENALWPVLTAALTEQKRSDWRLFEVRSRKVIFENYSLGIRMLDRLVSICCINADHAAKFRAEHVSLIESKWQLKTYFGWVRQDLVRDMEAALVQIPAQSRTTGTTPSSAFHHQLVARIWQLLLDLHSEKDSFLRQLSKDFLQLTFQLLARFGEWLQELITTEEGALKQLEEQTPAAGDTKALNALAENLRTKTKELATWTQDLGMLRWMLTHELADRVSTNIGLQDHTSIEQLFGRWYSQLFGPACERLVQCIVRLAARECILLIAEGLRGVLSMTLKLSGTEDQQQRVAYVEDAFKPLVAFLEQANAAARDATRDGWGEYVPRIKHDTAHAVAQNVFSRAREGIANVRNIEKQLTNLQKYSKKSKEGSQVSNVERITKQLQADLGRLVELAGSQLNITDIDSQQVISVLSEE